MTAISKPDTYSIPGQPEVDFAVTEVAARTLDRTLTVPMSELEMLTLAATDAAESIHTVPDFGEPTDDHRNERRIVGGGAVSAVEFAPVAVHEAVDETSFVVLTGYGRALRVFREDR
jgi:hypothetical protein